MHKLCTCQVPTCQQKVGNPCCQKDYTLFLDTNSFGYRFRYTCWCTPSRTHRVVEPRRLPKMDLSLRKKWSSFPAHSQYRTGLPETFQLCFFQEQMPLQSCPRCLQSCIASFTNQVTFKFSQCTKDMENQLAAWGAGVHALSE